MNARHLAIRILDQVSRSHDFADVILDVNFRKARLSHQDRALVTEIVYGTLRWQKWLDWILQHTYHGNWLKIPAKVRLALETGLYQILFLDRIPDHAAVNESVKIVVKVKGMGWARIVNAMLREILRRSESLVPPPMEEDPVKAIAIRWSHPEWLVQKWIDLWGVERTLSLCRADNERPNMGIRINRMRTDRAKLTENLQKLNINVKASQLLDDFLLTDKGGELLDSMPFKKGLFSVQDESAGLVGILMDPQRGERIVDMAAAPGGKSMHMAELANDRLTVIAVDLHRIRIQKVRENKSRLGLESIHPVVADSCKPGFRSVDRVLLDAPCSGLGVIRRRGELRWRRKPEEISRSVVLQKAMLEAGACLVRQEGVLVYSTCSILPEENEGVVDHFLNRHPDFVVEDARQFVDSRVVTDRGFIQTWPDERGIDGSFAVRLKRMR